MFDPGKFPGLQGQSVDRNLKKFQEEYEIIHEADVHYGMYNDILEESPEFEEEMKLASVVKDRVYESLQPHDDYVERKKDPQCCFS